MQKKSAGRETFLKRFPDSERGHTKSRASFLGDVEEEEDVKKGGFKNLEELTISPTKGDKQAFSKTPRAKMGEDPEDSTGEKCSKEESGREKKKLMKHLGTFLLSKHRNKR